MAVVQPRVLADVRSKVSAAPVLLTSRWVWVTVDPAVLFTTPLWSGSRSTLLPVPRTVTSSVAFAYTDGLVVEIAVRDDDIGVMGGAVAGVPPGTRIRTT